MPTFGDFSQDFIRCKVRRDFIRFRFKIVKQVGEFEKNIKKITKYWHQLGGKKHYFFAAYLNGVSLKMGWTRGSNPAAKSLDSGARITQVTRMTPLPHFTNPSYCPKRPYTRMHAGHSVLPSVSQG